MSKYRYLLLAALPLAAGAAEEVREQGDVLIVEEVRQPPEYEPAPARAVPTRGMDMANVRNVYGAPRKEHPAVGEPPITRWDYEDFSVFFEYDKVIHSVVTE